MAENSPRVDHTLLHYANVVSMIPYLSPSNACTESLHHTEKLAGQAYFSMCTCDLGIRLTA